MNLKNIYVYFRIWLGNGQTFINDFKYPVFLATMLKIYFPTITIMQTIILTVIAVSVMAFAGWFDLTFIHVAQTQADVSTSKYNPYFRRLERKLKSSSKNKKFK